LLELKLFGQVSLWSGHLLSSVGLETAFLTSCGRHGSCFSALFILNPVLEWNMTLVLLSSCVYPSINKIPS